MNILITDPIEEQAVEIFRKEGFRVDVRLNLSPEEIKEHIGAYDALIVRSGTKVTAEVIQAGKNLKIIGRAGTGVDNIDVDAATRRGIIVMNTPGGNTISTAEHTISMMLALARNIPQADASVKQGKWERKKYVGTELAGKTLGVVGLGKVGKEVAKRGQAFEMKVIAYDPLIAREVANKFNIELVDFDTVVKRSDFISIHTPLTEETENLFNKKTFTLCKKGVRIVNCARGGIVNEEDLLQALNDGIVAGAALDVFVNEPPGQHPLLQHPNVIVTPHLGASTEEAQEKVAIQIAQQVVDALRGKEIAGGVNADIVALAMKEDLQPYLKLAEVLGKLLIQLKEGQLRLVTLRTSGVLLNESSSALSAAILKGIFSHGLEETVNYLNAPLIARERGVKVNVTHGEADDFSTHLLSLEYETEKEHHTLSGTVYGKNNLRLVEVDGFRCEIEPKGYLLFYSNIDRPGMLAAAGAVLAAHNINIGGLSLGRLGSGKNAVTIMAIDTPANNAILEEIRSISGIFGVKMVHLPE
jgi:D-3-phosphoglycerate dehydrogenase